MLRSLTLTNWKSFGEGDGARNEVKFGALTVFVGPNGSGKSNVLDAIRFLKGLAHGFHLFDALRGRNDGVRELWTGVRGGDGEAVRIGQTSTSLFLRADIVERSVQYVGTFETQAPIGRIREIVRDPLVTNELRVESPLGAGTLVGSSSWAESVLGKGLPGPGRFGIPSHIIERDEPIRWTLTLADLLRGVLFLELSVREMSSPSPASATEFGRRGENIAAVLRRAAPDVQCSLADWLSEFCAPRVSGISFEVVRDLNDVYFFLDEQHGETKRRISARSLSDGTLRFLGILTALMTVPEGSIVVLEEPDAGLHPTRVHLLAELLESITAKRKIQVIATTHSPTLLANLSREAFANVVAFDRDRDTGWTVCSRVGDMEHKDIILDAPDRDHLIATGWLERAL